MASSWDDEDMNGDVVPDGWDEEFDIAGPEETGGDDGMILHQPHGLKGLDQNLNQLNIGNKDANANLEDGLMSDGSDDSDEDLGGGLNDDLNEESSEEESSSDEDEDGNDVEIDSKTQKFIDLLYLNAPRINLNLMHDFTESDLFTIDGDSILADLFSHEGLDFTHGGQLLHFVYLVEHFFQDFQKREGQFHIIFFSRAECLWHSDPLKLLARRMIIQHLKRNTKTTVITHIEDPFSDGWTKYIKARHPAFIMISDGESLKKRKGRRLIIRALLMSSVQHELDVAFGSSINRSLRSVNTFYVESRRAIGLSRRISRRLSKGQIKVVGGPDLARGPLFEKAGSKAYFLTTVGLRSNNAKIYSSSQIEMICDELRSVIIQHHHQLHLLTTCRDVITVISCAEILRKEKDEIDKVFSDGMTQAFILHTVLLQYLSLDARAQNLPDDACLTPYCEGLVKKYLRNLHYAMARVIAFASYDVLCFRFKDLEAMNSTESLADLMDGRLLYIVLYLMQNCTENDITASFPDEVVTKYKYLMQITLDLAHGNNSEPAKSVLQEDKVMFKAPVHIYANTSAELKSKKSLAENRKGLVKVSSRLATDYAGELLQELSSDTTTNLKSISAKPKKFIESYHWHSGKPLRDDYEHTKESEEKLSSDPKKRRKQLIGKQKFARYMQNYGESLEGRAHGLRQQTITVDLNNAAAKNKANPHQGQKKAKKTETKSVKEKILEEKKIKDREKADEDAKSRWSSIMPDLMADMESNKYTAVLKNIDNFLKRCASDKMTVEALLAKMDCFWRAWKGVNAVLKVRELTTANQSSLFSDLTSGHPMYYSIMLFVCCQEILDYQQLLSKKQLKMVAAYIRGLGFTAFAENIEAMEVESAGKMGSTKPVFSRVLPTQDECTVGMSCTRFQLKFVGQWMKRDERADKDPRVSHFIPDTWQRELLDAVDNNESALIVAPTSSGKTYASYYCMEKVLRQGNDGVVVYVSPTKALLNQVSATLKARFTKKLPPGRAIVGMFSRDFTHDALNSQALMNQVSATLYARFTKKLPPGRVICGVFSRDFRRHALDCQILVTVPQCLEILLLSPRRQEWTKRIQYVIFDEVHCLGGEIGAEVWEHLLVTIKCPFLALSATVRNPDDIKGWLQESQNFKKTQAEMVSSQRSTKKKAKPHSTDNNAYNVKLVVYRERHSDLEKFIYLPDEKFIYLPDKPEQLLLPNDACLHDTKGFLPIHPVAMLNLIKVKAQGLPADLSLSPREALVLYDVMKAIHPNSSHVKAFDPEVYFHDIPVLTKQDARKYENDLKKELMRWITDGHSDKVEQVIQKISGDTNQQLTKCKQSFSKMKVGSMFTDSVAVGTYAKLVRQLNEQHKLPALVFSQNRNLCERLAGAVAYSLHKAEEELRDRFEKSHLCKEVEKIMDRLEKLAKKRKNADSDTMEKRKPNKDKFEQGDVRLRGRREKEISDSWGKRPPWRRRGANRVHADADRFADCLKEADDPTDQRKLMEAKPFLLDDPLPSCTLQGEGNLSQDELDEILANLPYDDKSNQLRWLISRGVAYHHSGLNNKQRVAVETLFRMKHLKVVSATATLALGIHMPCKTVVFVCEDLWLKPLAFRQMSGRSGRRGFDLVGNVIFHCIPKQKIQHLITSGLPHLTGHFPFSVSLVLRLMVLTHNSEDKRNAHEKALTLLKHPFVCHKAKGMEEVVQHFFLFSVDYLVRVGLLEADGTPIGLSGLATHLHYHEPANLTFVSMLQEGAFHKLCTPSSDGTFSVDVMESIVMILAQMFSRVLVPMSHYRRIKKQGVHSKVVFGKDLLMPPEFSAILKRHNEDVMRVFRRYIQTVCDYAAQSDSVQQNVLPLSKVVIEPSTVSDSATEAPSTNVMQRLAESANQSSTLSPFVMTSGHADEDLAMFDSDISQAIRQGVHIETTKIPTLKPPAELRDIRGKQLFINAYAYDFFKHGSKKLIGRDNGLDSGEVFDKLNDFKLVIAAISVALDELGPEEDNVVWAFRQLKEEYRNIFSQEFPHVRD